MNGGGFRQLKLLHTASQWQQACQARPSKSLILSQTDSAADAQLNRYRDYLGHEFSSVFLDCHDGLNADAICALCGTIIGSGQLVIFLPAKPSAMTERLTHYAHTYFPAPQHARSNHDFQTAITERQELASTLAGEFINGGSIHTHILIAERGRGKSTLLGKVLNDVIASAPTTDIVVTAPRKANAQVLLEQAPAATFRAWDKLLEHPGNKEIHLIIDEAAGIPLWATEKLCQKFTPWLLATTVSGYEGCGRGFAIHFKQWAQTHLSKVKHHPLLTPMRWPSSDPLERWLTDTFLMDESSVEPTPELPDGQFIDYAANLQESTLRQCFQLLLNAHYQSSPNDLNLLLSDSLHRLAYCRQDGEIIAVAWLIEEGPVPTELHVPILQGERRPKGNLLPQAVGYFLQQPWALTARWLRVARIAVPAHKRQRGYASALLTHIFRHPAHRNIDQIGTSFAWEPNVAKFWEANGYVPWRTSHRIGGVSARPAAIYVLSDTDQNACQGSSPNTTAIRQWAHAEHQWLMDAEIALTAPLTQHPFVKLLTDAYLQARIPFDAAHFALALLYQNFAPTADLTHQLCMPSFTLKQLAQYYDCHSQQQATVKLRKDTAQLT